MEVGHSVPWLKSASTVFSTQKNITTERLWTFLMTSAESVTKRIHYLTLKPLKPLTRTVLFPSSTWRLKPQWAPFHLIWDTRMKDNSHFLLMASNLHFWLLASDPVAHRRSWISAVTSPDRYLISLHAVYPFCCNLQFFYVHYGESSWLGVWSAVAECICISQVLFDGRPVNAASQCEREILSSLPLSRLILWVIQYCGGFENEPLAIVFMAHKQLNNEIKTTR